jgi:hypothetical protein
LLFKRNYELFQWPGLYLLVRDASLNSSEKLAGRREKASSDRLEKEILK